LIVNISGTDKNIEYPKKRRSNIQSRPSVRHILANFGPLTKKLLTGF